VSLTLSPPIRVFALLGVLVATGVAAFVFLVASPQGEAEPIASKTPPTRPAQKTKPAPKAPARQTPTRPAARQTKSGFPAPVDRALRHNRVVVVAVYMPGAGVDSIVRREARAAAISAHAGYVPISALSERLVRPLMARTGVLPDPAVVVVKRPGVVTAMLSVADRDTIAQAIVQAKKR
jgi:hypothetical protein